MQYNIRMKVLKLCIWCCLRAKAPFLTRPDWCYARTSFRFSLRGMRDVSLLSPNIIRFSISRAFAIIDTFPRINIVIGVIARFFGSAKQLFMFYCQLLANFPSNIIRWSVDVFWKIFHALRFIKNWKKWKLFSNFRKF